MSSLQARSLAANAPSPAASNASGNGSKRKRTDDGPNTVWSQPSDTGENFHLYTNVTYVLAWMREQPEKWFTLQEIIDYLNIREENRAMRYLLREFLQAPKAKNSIEWNVETDKYRFKPPYDIRNSADLRRYLQNQKSAQGLSVKTLKEGWVNVQEDLRILEARQQVLVKHNQKDLSAKTVWNNDPTLMHHVDPEFKEEWHHIIIPQGQDDLRKSLVASGIKPSSVPRLPTTTKPKDTKRKTARRGGKLTNTHMQGILKDFSHLRK